MKIQQWSCLFHIICTNQQLPATCGAWQLSKLKRFLATLQQFGNDISPEIGEKVRTLVLAPVNSTVTIEEFLASSRRLQTFLFVLFLFHSSRPTCLCCSKNCCTALGLPSRPHPSTWLNANTVCSTQVLRPPLILLSCSWKCMEMGKGPVQRGKPKRAALSLIFWNGSELSLSCERKRTG